MAVGFNAGLNNIAGTDNVFVGFGAGQQALGSQNILIGSTAGLNLVRGTGNIFIGTGAGYYAASTNNKLYIDNVPVDSSDAFIYGDMEADSLRLNANTNITCYTRLGYREEAAPAIKIKKLTINLPGTQGATTLVAHGLTQSKILSISSLATVGIYKIPQGFLQSGFQYTLNVDSGNIAVNTVAGQSGSILNAPVVILVTYEQ